MTQGSVGWLCPKCSAVISPYTASCAKCTLASSVSYGPSTITIGGLGGTYTFGGPSYQFTSGTVYIAPRSEVKPDPKDAKLKEWRDWRDKVIELRDELDELIEEVEDMDE